MTTVTLLCLITLIVAQRWITSNGQICLSPKPANVRLSRIVGKFYFIDIWVRNVNSNTNCVTVNYPRTIPCQPRLQNYTYLDSEGKIRTDQYILRETSLGKYTRQNATNAAEIIPVTILYYNGVHLFVYGCLETDQAVHRYVLMSKHQTVTQACIDAIYRASEPVAPGFTVHKATYNGCDINNL